MSLVLVYDDSRAMPDHLGALTGVGWFGQLIHRRRTLAEHFLKAAEEAGIGKTRHVRSRGELLAVLDDETLRGDDSRFIHVPSNLVARDFCRLKRELGKLRYADHNVAFEDNASGGRIVMLDRPTFRRFLAGRLNGADHGSAAEADASLYRLNDMGGLIDLDDQARLLEFISGGLDARHFNSVTQTGHTLAKHSADRAKIRREYRFYHLLPEEMRHHFVMPFNLQESPDGASYRMERLHIPDMSIQWTQNALSDEEFAGFLERLFGFVDQRRRRSSAPAEVEHEVHRLYLVKTRERLNRLSQMPVYPVLDRFVGCSTRFSGIAELSECFFALFRETRAGRREPVLVIGHGDLCFSNILYDRRLQLMRLIDPRGADSEDELWTDPYYDIAKLCHSVLGGYDYVNRDLFDICVTAELRLDLATHAPDQTVKQRLFRDRLTAGGFDLRVARMCEAALFLSMLPLHAEAPRKLLGYILTAARILESIDRQE